MHQGGSYRDLKYGVFVFLGHALIIIKWTFGFFPKKLQFEPPPTILHKRLSL